jgi:hypothetical protein
MDSPNDRSSLEGGEPQDAGNAVEGIVLDISTTRPLAGRLVAIQDQHTSTDANGRFRIFGVGPTYDAIVVEPDFSEASIYKGLARRDPVLSHQSSLFSNPMSSVARVRGTISGGGPYPLGPADVVEVYFFANETDSYALLGGGLPPIQDGPTYGPMGVTWGGPNPVTGTLLAMGLFDGGADAGYSYWFASQGLTLTNGQTTMANLNLAPTSERPLAGSIDVPTGFSLEEQQAFYRMPFPHAVVTLLNESTSSLSFAYTIPDLSGEGAVLCVEEVATPGLLTTQQCGITPGSTDVAVHLQPPPTLTSPASGGTVTKGTSFAWTNFPGGVYELAVDARVPSPASPSFHVFTADHNADWPDLSALGVASTGTAAYQCTIAGAGPFATIDEALGPDGISKITRGERRWSSADPIAVTVVQ